MTSRVFVPSPQLVEHPLHPLVSQPQAPDAVQLLVVLGLEAEQKLALTTPSAPWQVTSRL